MARAPGRAGAFAAGIALGASGCLWIDGSSHDDREALLAFELGPLRVEPVGLAACLSTQTLLTVDAPVGLQHDGEAFAVSTRFGDAEQVEQGAITVVNGALTFAVDASGWAADPLCAAGCVRQLAVTATRLGVRHSQTVDVPLIGPAVPVLGDVTLIDAGGAETPLDDVPRAASPADAIVAADWPALAVEVRDPHLVLGAAGWMSVWACPGVTTPDSPGASCVSEPALPEGDAPTDPRRFTVATAPLAAGICAGGVIDPTWRLFARIEQHPCGGPYTFALSEAPAVLVESDCDGDGLDAGQDCDDLADTVFPGAVEVCDGLDNDCAGGEGTQAATVFPASGAPPVNVAGPTEAVTAAQSGDTVGVCPGTYAVDLVLGKSLAVVGAGDAETVVLTSRTAGRPVVSVALVDPPAELTLEALTVTGGTGVAVGGGIDARDAGSVLVDGCVVTGNSAARGGGIALGGDATVRSTRIEANDAQDGGGLAIDPGASVSFVAATIASNTADRGAGLHVDGVGDAVSLVFDAGSLAVSNRASAAGGGLWATGLASVVGGRFTANEAPSGGGLALDAAGLSLGAVVVTLDGVDIQSNQAEVDGGGVLVTGPVQATLVDCAFQLDAAGAHGGGLAALDGALVTVSGGSFDTNVADADGGGAFAADATLEVDITTFATNLAVRGGGVALVDADATFGAGGPVDLSANTAYDAGGGVWVRGGALAYPSGALTGNSAATGGGFAMEQAASVAFGGSLADSAGYGFVVSGGASLTVDAGASLADNGDDRVEAGTAEVCLGAQVDELVSSTGGDSGGDADCFVVTEAGYTDGCTCP